MNWLYSFFSLGVRTGTGVGIGIGIGPSWSSPSSCSFSQVSVSETSKPCASLNLNSSLLSSLSDAGKIGDPVPAPPSEELTDQQKEKALARCSQIKNQAIASSPQVNYMIRALARKGCPVSSNFFRCQHCPTRVGGFLSVGPDENDISVVMCQNYVSGYKMAVGILTHELIHAYDLCRAEMDVTDCHHHACTEIRAANLSGDCNILREWKRLNYHILDHHKSCVRRRAIISVANNPNCPGIAATKAVDKVFDQCYADTEPFGSIP